ncbi:MAG TPA: GtrA family protein [Ktedonobacteraceae bacterium]
MEQSLLESKFEEAAEAHDSQELLSVAHRVPSYRPTRWAIVNRALHIVDEVTHGRAGLCQRFFSFAFIGGLASLVNLAVFAYVMYEMHFGTMREELHNVIAYIAAAEISIIANFIPNDYFTFRDLDGHSRSWFARCGRFHLAASSGVLLTFLIEFAFRFLAHIPAIIGQAVAILIVLFYNFSIHHLFTYRHVKTTQATR